MIMSYKQIVKHNFKIFKKNNSLINMNNYSISEQELLKLITNFEINDNLKNNLTFDTVEDILKNRNIDKIDVINIKTALVINRCNLRNLPTSNIFYKDNPNFDILQETALHTATPIYILHQSFDKNWYFVQSNFSYGWIHKNDFVFVNKKEFDLFLNPKKFLIITNSLLYLENIYLDMGVKLPYVKSNNYYYTALIPTKTIDKVHYKEILISKKDANIGYLDYTYKNLYNQLLKYLGTNYGWGDLNYGVDCTSFAANVYHTFGFLFPRNSNEQYNTVGTQIYDLTKFKKDEIIKFLSKKNMGILYTKKHCLIYLGTKKNQQYVIHSYGKTMSVVITTLENADGIDLYDQLISFNLIQ